MGHNFFSRRQKTQDAGPTGMNRVNERYNDYFPRVYAYVYSCVGGELPTEDIVVQAFSRAFMEAGNDEERFRAILFRTARHLCHPALKQSGADEDDSLSTREREVISLVFDAGLTRGQIARLFRIRETMVTSLLMTGLRKLKEQTSPAAAAAYLTLA